MNAPFPKETSAIATVLLGCSNSHFGATAPLGTEQFRVGLPVSAWCTSGSHGGAGGAKSPRAGLGVAEGRFHGANRHAPKGHLSLLGGANSLLEQDKAAGGGQLVGVRLLHT